MDKNILLLYIIMRREDTHASIVVAPQDTHVTYVIERREERQIMDLVIRFRHIVGGLYTMLGSLWVCAFSTLPIKNSKT